MDRWTNITSYADEASALDDIVSEIVSSEQMPLPPFDVHVGHVQVHWDDVGGRRCQIQSKGGTASDRLLARQVVAGQLASCGFREAEYDWSVMEKTADWNQIMNKAKRLIQSGNVQILRNGYQNIVARVKGDGTDNGGTPDVHQCEIFRADPNSRAITTSDCDCGWGEFQNQPRTREFKRFQGRPCAHILAAFWVAQSMPLDEDANPNAPQPGGGPQAPGGFGQGSGFGPDADTGFDPAQRSFDPSGAAGFSAGPGGPPAAGGPQTGGEEPTGPSPADVLPQYPMAQMPQPQPQNLVSIPGATPPSPTNPTQYPAGPGGTFSSVWGGWKFADAEDEFGSPNPTNEDMEPRNLQNGDLVQLRYPDTGTLVGRSEEHGAGQPFNLTPGMVGEVRGTDPATGMIEVLYMGKPFDQNKRMEPFGATAWHWPSYVLHRPDLKKPGPAIRRVR